MHIERGPVPDDTYLALRDEARVDDIATRRLIDLDALIDVLAWNRYRVDDGAAEDLWVTTRPS